jgi:hypothetical protein
MLGALCSYCGGYLTYICILYAGRWELMNVEIKIYIYIYIYIYRGMRWRSWLVHCAASRKVAGSISDGVIGIFH